ncbi:hypothetical protein Q8A67_021693 [Cirrhinus molitorella]|uniref:Uncharacterized protein n=1 Tax=Cirrhinus molitorella TaxID=172907 RepID=A0AA88TDA7_9TELE|nr:hypothetical protein Q8A67_021693 [Cirrhinus molitorella]
MAEWDEVQPDAQTSLGEAESPRDDRPQWCHGNMESRAVKLEEVKELDKASNDKGVWKLDGTSGEEAKKPCGTSRDKGARKLGVTSRGEGATTLNEAAEEE